MQSFSSLSGMHKVALELLAFAAPSAQVDTLRAVFCAIDADGSGSISREEFSSALGAHPQLKESEVVRIFDQIDFSRQGEVSYNEFLAATLGALSGGTRGLDEESVRAVFERLDTDSDGVVTRDNLVRALGGAISSGEVDAWFEQIGCTNGKLLIGDLLRLMLEQRVEAGVDAQPLAPQLSRSLSSNNVTLTSEAQLAAKAKEELTGDGKHPRAMMAARPDRAQPRHFIRESQPGEAAPMAVRAVAPRRVPLPRRRQRAAAQKSMDGSVFATFSKWTSTPRGSSTSIRRQRRRRGESRNGGIGDGCDRAAWKRAGSDLKTKARAAILSHSRRSSQARNKLRVSYTRSTCYVLNSGRRARSALCLGAERPSRRSLGSLNFSLIFV